MAKFEEQVTRLWDEWMKETGLDAGDPSEFVDWAVQERRLLPRPQDVKKVLRRQVTASLRSVRRFDEEGRFTYRAKQSVTLFEDGEARKVFFDTDTGGSPALRQKSVKQRREAIADDVYRAASDVERMNKMHRDDPQLSFFMDFSDDFEEHRIAEQQSEESKRDTIAS